MRWRAPSIEWGEIGALHAAHREKLLLRRNPVGNIQIDERLAFGNAIERRAHVQALDETGRARLHDGLITLVVGDAADGR